MATLSPYVFWQELDNDGDPLAGGKVYSYEAGTTTPKDTYTDSTGNVANANPIILDSAGRAAVWLGDGGYKFILKDSGDVTIRTVDNTGGTSDTAFAGTVNDLTDNTSITTVYKNSALICDGTFSLSLLPVSEAGEGFYFIARNNGTGVITIDPNASETIDGAATITIGAGSSTLIICDGDEWFSFILSIASQAEAEAGTNNSKAMTPLRTKQSLTNAWPVGSLFLSTVSTNPATLLGFGTWVAYGAGRCFLGVGTGNDGTDSLVVAAGATGGKYKHTLTNAESARINGSFNSVGLGGTASATGTGFSVSDSGDGNSYGASGGVRQNLSLDIGGGGAHNNTQPYIGVYVWHRTA